MRHRDAARPAPRTHVLYPQRALTAGLFMAFGVFGLWQTRHLGTITSVADVGIIALMALFPLSFFLIGLHAWLRKVKVELWDDGKLVVSSTRWPLRGESHELAVSDVVDVISEPSSEQRPNGPARLVVVTRTERIPLTKTATSDNLAKKVAAMRAFLGLAAPPAT